MIYLSYIDNTWIYQDVLYCKDQDIQLDRRIELMYYNFYTEYPV